MSEGVGWLVTWATPAHPALVVIELLDPDDPQPLDRGQPAQPEPLRFGEQGGQQVMAIGAHRLAQSLAGSLAFGQTVLLDPSAPPSPAGSAGPATRAPIGR